MGKVDSNRKNDLTYKVYLAERKSLIDAEREESRLFDRAILTLAAGAFGLSLTFIRQIVPDIKPRIVYLLILAWSGFCVSLLSTLISFLTSQSACSKQREILEEEYCNDYSNQDKKAKSGNKAAIWTKRLNVLSIVAFIIGVVFLAVFSTINLLP